jgi:hypothetical protein
MEVRKFFDSGKGWGFQRETSKISEYQPKAPYIKNSQYKFKFNNLNYKFEFFLFWPTLKRYSHCARHLKKSKVGPKFYLSLPGYYGSTN